MIISALQNNFRQTALSIVEIWVCNWVILIKFICMEGNVFFNMMTQKNDILFYCEIENYNLWKFGIRYRLT